jgi:hypothetical protein
MYPGDFGIHANKAPLVVTLRITNSLGKGLFAESGSQQRNILP